jgi:excisionase family DNA binding protein
MPGVPLKKPKELGARVALHWESPVPRQSAIPTFVPSFIETVERFDRSLIAKEVAELFRLKLETVYRHARNHEIPSFRVGGSVRFDPLVLSRWMRSRSQSTGGVQ